MKNLLYVLLFLTFSVFSQKKLEKEIPVAAAIETIYIDLNTVFSVSIKTHKKSYIKVVGESEGEYANNFVLQNKVENGSVLLSGSNASFVASFQISGDTLMGRFASNTSLSGLVFASMIFERKSSDTMTLIKRIVVASFIFISR